jgi:hypothetical protein
VYQENYFPEPNEELSRVRNQIGDLIGHPAESCLMILKDTDLHLLHLLSINGAMAPEILHTAKSMSNGNVKFCQDMNYLMESVSGTMVTLEPSSFLNPKHYE